MQRLFFHNQHDALSRDMVKDLPDDVRIYDVFGEDEHNLPPDIRLTTLPYMVDKYLYTDTLSPVVNVGTVALLLHCRNYLDEPLTDNQKFTVNVNDERYTTRAEDGLINIEIECDEPTAISLLITSHGYLPFAITIEVKNNVES